MTPNPSVKNTGIKVLLTGFLGDVSRIPGSSYTDCVNIGQNQAKAFPQEVNCITDNYYHNLQYSGGLTQHLEEVHVHVPFIPDQRTCTYPTDI